MASQGKFVSTRMTRNKRDRTLTIGIALLIALALACLLVPIFAQGDPLAIGDVLSLRLLPPFSRGPDGHWHLLGTDRFGRDLFVRMMLAGRVSLAVGVAGSVIAASLGTFVGAVAAWRGGWRASGDRCVPRGTKEWQAVRRGDHGFGNAARGWAQSGR